MQQEEEFQHLLTYIDDEKLNVKAEALRVFVAILQSHSRYSSLIEHQHQKTIVSLIALIQHSDDVCSIRLHRRLSVLNSL